MTDDPAQAAADLINGPRIVSTPEAVGFVTLFRDMLNDMERRLLERMAENARAAEARWAANDAEHAKIMEQHDALATIVREHHHEAEVRKITADARVRPIRSVGAFLNRYWERVVLVLILVSATIGAVVETFGRILGPHVP